MAHIHAELMKQYAEDAANYDEPWKLWEYLDMSVFDGQWIDIDCHPGWKSGAKYRRKLIKPDPLKETPVRGSSYFYLELTIIKKIWEDFNFENEWLESGMIFENKFKAEQCRKWLRAKLKEASNDNN